MIYCGPWLGNCRYQKILSLVAIVVWLQDMFTSCPSYESMKMGWEVLAKLKVPVEVKKNNTSSYLEIKLKVQLCTLQVLSQVNPLFPHHIQTHTIYFSLVFWDTFFKIIYSEESQEHMNRQFTSYSCFGTHCFIYIYSEESQEHMNRSGRSNFLLPWIDESSVTPNVFISLTPDINAKEQPGEK